MANEVSHSDRVPLQTRGTGKVLLSAFGVHVGGGLVLLESMLSALGDSLRAASLDSRLDDASFQLAQTAAIERVRPSMVQRLTSLRRLTRLSQPGDVLFCFNSLPPLWKPAGLRVVNYVHAPHFVGAHMGVTYTPVTSARIAIERAWFRLGIKNCDEAWVQTSTMAQRLRALHPGLSVRVVPFVDRELFAALQRDVAPPVVDQSAREPGTFFYPAEAVGHKNHINLLRAWQMLAEQGCRPLLQLTLRPHELQAVLAQAALPAALANVVNLGRLPRAAVLSQLEASSALVFPSKAETFGLPLLEAHALSIPVLAAERDFVRDVCVPVQTFDPDSPRSIADAVLRFLGRPGSAAVQALSAPQVVQLLLR